MTYNEWRARNGYVKQPSTTERMAEDVFSLFCASGLTAWEVRKTISRLSELYEKRKKQDEDRPLMEINKEYTAESKDIFIEPGCYENVLVYMVLQKLETMHQVAISNQKEFERLERILPSKGPIFGKISPLAISITALVVSVVTTVIGIVC